MTARCLASGLALAACVVVASVPCVALSAPTRASHRTRVARPTKPATVVCQPLFVCDIVLDAGETVLAMATGDSVRWMLSTVMSGSHADTPHVLVKPIDYDIQTDLIIATDKRVCYLILASTQQNDHRHTRLFYPVAEVAQVVRSAEADNEGPLVSLTRLDFAYRVRGDRGFLPTRVMNDGAHTYIQMPPAIEEMPVVFAIANDGSDAIVNYRFQHDTFVVDGVPQRLVLVQGAGRGQRRVSIERGN